MAKLVKFFIRITELVNIKGVVVLRPITTTYCHSISHRFGLIVKSSPKQFFTISAEFYPNAHTALC